MIYTIADGGPQETKKDKKKRGSTIEVLPKLSSIKPDHLLTKPESEADDNQGPWATEKKQRKEKVRLRS